MSNLTPDDVNILLTETRNELQLEDGRLWEGLEDEKISRIAGDKANKDLIDLTNTELAAQESRLSTEVVQRAEGDLRNVNSLSELAKALSDYRIKNDLELNNERIAREQLGVDLNHKIDLYTSTFDHKFLLVYQSIQTFKDETNNTFTSFDERIKKYEDMLQDITTDSIQITMDNGEINMGAWTILSQAREWDLEILGKFKDYQTQTNKDIDDALKDIQDKLPVEQDIIDKALEALAQSPIVKELDEKLNSNIEDISNVQKQVLAEAEQRRTDMINLANNTANTMKENQKELLDKLTTETQDRVDAVQREAQIRQEQLVQESQDRTAEIEEKLEGVWAGIDEETQERLKQIDQLNDGLTKEIQERTDGDTKNLKALENYKESTDTALGNMQTSVDIAVSNSAVAVNKVDALDGRLTTVDQNANTALNNSALALDKANIAINESSVTAGKVSAVEADMVNVKNDVAANAKGLTDITATVSDLDGVVKANTQAITDVQGGLKTANDTIATQGQAITSLEVTTKQTKDELATVVSDVSTVKADLKNAQDGVAANGQAIQDITIKVGQNTDGLTSLGQKVTTIENSVADLDKTKADASYVETIDNKVTDLGGVVTSNTNDIVTIKNNVNTIQGDLAGKASTEYVDSVNNQTQINKDAIKAQQDKLVSLDASINQSTNAILINGGSDLTNDLTRAYNTPGYLGKTSNPTASNTNYIVVGNSSGADNLWIHSSRFLVFDPKRMYRLRVRFCVYETKAGTATFYFGIASKTADKSLYVNSDGVPTDGPASSFYMLYAFQPTVGQWVEREFYISGRSLTGVAAGNGTLESPSQLMNNAAHIAPLFIEDGATTTVLLDYMSLEIADDIKLVNGQAKVIESLTSRVGTTEQGIETLTNKTDILQNRINVVEGDVKNSATAESVRALDQRVTQNESDIQSQSTAYTKLSNDLKVIGDSSQNILVNSNKVQLYEEGKYPHAVYSLGEPWIVGEKYTLIYCAEHKRGPADGITVLAPYAGGGLEGIVSANFPINGDKQVVKGTFVAGDYATSAAVHFYLLNHGNYSQDTVATIYWAVLVRGEFGSSKNWFPSPYDYVRDWSAQADANQSLHNEVGVVDGKVTSLNNAITTLNGQVSNIEGELVKKADVSALEGLQTKAEVDNAIALSNTKLTASLYSGNMNLLKESALDDYNHGSWIGNGGNTVLIKKSDWPNVEFPPNGRKAVWQINGWGGAGMYQPVTGKFKAGEPLTCSIWAYGDYGTEVLSLMTEGIQLIEPNSSYLQLTNKWKRYTVKGYAVTDSINLVMYLGPTMPNGTQVLISEVKLERGLIGSDWSESAAETQTRLDATSTAISETRTAVEKLDGRVSTMGTDIINLTGRVDTAERNVTGLFDATRTLSGRVENAENNININSQGLTKVNATLATRNDYYISTFRNGSTLGPAPYGLVAADGRHISGIGRGLTIYVYKPDGSGLYDVRFFDTYGDLANAYNLFVFLRDAVPDQYYFSIVGNDNVGWLIPTDEGVRLLREAIVANGGTVDYFNKWGDNRLPIFTSRKGAATGTGICHMFASSVQNDWIRYPLTLIAGVPSGLAGAPSIDESKFATADALSLLNAEVKQNGRDIATNANSITNVNASVNNINNIITIRDTRNDNFDPEYYRHNFTFRTVNEFKSTTVIGVYPLLLIGFCNLSTIVPWGDPSGGPVQQVASSGDGNTLAYRYSTGPRYSETWTAWVSPTQDLMKSLGTKAEAKAVTDLSARVDVVDGRVTSVARDVTQLQTDIGDNSAKLNITAETVDGMKAGFYVKTDVNGLVSGFGTYNDGVTSVFGVNADMFYIGKGSGGKKPFIVTTTTQTIDGVTYPAGTWIDVALIANATIGSAHIANAAITNAHIANLDAAKITSGYIDAARIKAGSISADKMTIGLTDNLWPNRYFDPNGPLLVNSRVKMIADVTEIGGYGMQIYGRDHVAYSLKMPVRPGDQIVIEYTAALGGGPNRPLGVGLWVYDDWGQTGSAPWQYGPAEQLYEVQYGWYRYRRTFTVTNNGSGRLAKSGALYFQIEQSDNEANPTYWNIGDVTVRRRSGGELIVDGSITATKLHVDQLSAISGNLGTLTTYKDPAQPNKARMVMQGSLITVYDDNNRVRVRLGLW